MDGSLLVVAAVPQELASFHAVNQKVSILWTGMGRRAGQVVADRLKRDQVRAVISAGFAGGTRAGFRVGDLLAPSEVMEAATGRIYRPSAGASSLDGIARAGRLVTVDRVVRDGGSKGEMGVRYQAVAVDLETSSVAEACERAGVPWLALRAILDPMEVSLAAGSWMQGAALAVMPWRWAQLGRLRAAVRVAADSLGRGLETAMSEIEIRGRTMDLGKISALIESEYAFLQGMRSKWSLTEGPQDMELVAHALRVILHVGRVKESLPEYRALVRVQHADGGWGRESQEQASAAWVSAFCALMLIRANAVLGDAEIEQSVWKSIDYFLQGQKPDGRWVDSEWGDLDTTSHPISFFNVVLALGTDRMKERVRGPWRRGLRFILDGQSEDGGWYDPIFQPSGVETTAHLVQDAVIASLVLPGGLPVRPTCERGLKWILEHQAADGSWDDQNVDHTMDCTRSALLISRMLRSVDQASEALERAMEWIVGAKNPSGWPDFPGMETNLERTCDGLDVLLKYQAWRQADPLEVVRRWGYASGNPLPQPDLVGSPVQRS